MIFIISFIIILAIIFSIILGYKTKVNTGFFAIGFSYIIGCFILDLKPTQVIEMWPIKIFFVIFSVSIFYNFALSNGTLEKLSQHLLYSTRKVPHLLPFAIFFAAIFISALGAGYFTVLAFFAPITILLCEQTGLNKLIGAMAVNYGSLAGANFMTSASGLIFKGLIENAGYTENAYSFTTSIFLTSVVIPFFIILASILVNKNNNINTTNFSVTKPEKFNTLQKTTLNLIFAMVFIVLIVPILRTTFPENIVIKFINSKMDIGLVSIIFTIFAFILKLGKEKEIIAKIPWNTIIMICGVGMLISTAIKAGTITILSGWIGTNIPTFLVPITLCIIGGMMSFFSSTLGVVAPALFPIIPTIAEVTNLNPATLFVAIIIGAQATSISPFSSGGSLILGSAPDETKTDFFNQLMFKGAPICLGIATVTSVILTFII